MATQYVSNSTNNGHPLGSDSNDGSIGSPWLTIQKAVDSGTSGNTFKINEGTYVEAGHTFLNLDRAGTPTMTFEPWDAGTVVLLATTHASYAVYQAATGTYTFKEIDVKTASPLILVRGAANIDYNMTFDKCDFDTLASTNNYLFYGSTHTSAPEGSIVFQNGCTFTNDSNQAQPFYIQDCKTFKMTDCTINRTTPDSGSDKLFAPNGKVDLIHIANNTITVDGISLLDCQLIGSGEYIERIKFNGNTITGGTFIVLSLDSDIRLLEIDGNTITSSYANNKIALGASSGATTNTINAAKISNNKMRLTGSSGHFIMLGTNCNEADVYNNDLEMTDTDDFGIVVKGRYNSIFDNYVKSADCLYISGGQYNRFFNNTAIAIGKAAFLIGTNADADLGIRNEVYNNVFDASAGGTYAVEDKSSPLSDWDNRFDYNVLIAGSTDLAKLDGTDYSTIAAMQTKWAAWSDFWPDNDKNSFEGRAIQQMGRPQIYGYRPHVGAKVPVGIQDKSRYKMIGAG